VNFMASSDRRDLPTLHAVMDEVDALHAARTGVPDASHLVDQVAQTYNDMGVAMDRNLIEQVVAKRMGEANGSALTHPISVGAVIEAPVAPFDFGWNRPLNVDRWRRRQTARHRHTVWLARFTKGASSVAFFVWLWLLLGSVPEPWDHPWLFAFACMGVGSVLEQEVKRREKADEALAQAKVNKRRQLYWKLNGRAQDYLRAVLAQGNVPLLNADVKHLDAMVGEESGLVTLRDFLGALKR
jgi:hypothetical protein